MITYKEEQILKEIPVGIKCDRCGLESTDETSMIQIRHEYTFGSPKDTDYIECDLCEKCFDETVKNKNLLRFCSL